MHITTDSDTTTHSHDPQDRHDRHDRARDGVEHLQAAARELIHAARAVLDVAEDLIDDPDAVASAAGAVGALGDLVRQRAGAWSGAASRAPGPAGDRGRPGPAADGDGAIERITVV